MNSKQRSLYFRTLWPAACKAQGWSTKDEPRRRAVTTEATGQPSSSGLNESQITALFDHLKWLADPYSLEAAMIAANPDLAEQANRRRQLVWRITQALADASLTEQWLQQTTTSKCRAHGVGKWSELPLAELLKLSFTVERRTNEGAKARRSGRQRRPAGPTQADCRPAADPQAVLPF